MELIKKLNKIQKELKAPKNQYNSFGKYHYRNAEDILEAVKPLLDDVILIINDDIVLIGDRYYVKSTAKITDGKDLIENSAFAREALDKKGMDESQITGASSSYARKYALNGLFLIDDTKDADNFDNRKNSPKTSVNTSKPSDVSESLEKPPVCNICGQEGMKAKTKTGRQFWTCPDWQQHRKTGEKFEMIHPQELDEKTKEFIKGLDAIK